MSTLALNRRVLAWAGAPLLLLAACGDDAVTPQDDTTTATSSESGGSTMGTTDGVDTSSSGNEPTSNGSETEPTTTQTPPTTDPDTSSSEGSSGPLPAVCGNNVIEDEEVCDLAQVNGETCESLGYEGGQLGCMLTCDAYNLLGCFICGNEVIDLAEDCEGEVPEDVTCESLGFQDGFVTCGDDCLYDTSECSVCGDGIAAGFEACDADGGGTHVHAAARGAQVERDADDADLLGRDAGTGNGLGRRSGIGCHNRGFGRTEPNPYSKWAAGRLPGWVSGESALG